MKVLRPKFALLVIATTAVFLWQTNVGFAQAQGSPMISGGGGGPATCSQCRWAYSDQKRDCQAASTYGERDACLREVLGQEANCWKNCKWQ